MALWGRFLPIAVAAACLLAMLAGCGSGDDTVRNPEDGRNSLVAEELPEVEVPVRWASANARDLKTLIASTGTVFVGEVTALSGQRTVEAGVDPAAAGDPPSANSPKNGVTRRASLPISTYELTVVRSLAGGLAAGQTVSLEQPGGVKTLADGSPARIEFAGDEPLQVGARYLIFAVMREDGVLTTSPFGRFLVDEGGSLAPSSEWSDLPVSRRLAGVAVDEAAREVQNAR